MDDKKIFDEWAESFNSNNKKTIMEVARLLNGLEETDIDEVISVINKHFKIEEDQITINSMYLDLLVGFIQYCQELVSMTDINIENAKFLYTVLSFTSQEISKQL